MATYRFNARDGRGALLTGFQEASSETEAVKILQTRGLLITKIAPAQEGGVKKRGKKTHRGVKMEDYLVFTRETATLLEAGIPLLRTIEVIAEQTESDKLEKTLHAVLLDIRAGSTFRDAIAKHPKVFPSLWVHLIEAGELSGNLIMVLGQIADNLETNIGLKKKLISALSYPIVLICVAIGAVFVFLLKIIPVFDNLFKSMNAKLPFLTQIVIDASHFLQKHFVLFIVTCAVAGYLLRRYLGTEAGRRQRDALLLKMPVFGALMKDAILARITINFATLNKSGVNLLQTVEITGKTAGNWVFEQALQKTKVDIQQGKTMSSSLAESPLFSPLMIHMIMIGEESGKLSDMLERVAKYYQGKVEVFLGRLSVLMEPIILIVIGGVIAFLVIAMFLPILSLSQIVK